MRDINYIKATATFPATTTYSDVLDLTGARAWSCLGAFTDASDSAAKTFVSGTYGYLAVQDLTYTAKTIGAGSSSITIAYTTGGTAGSEVVTVVASAISVKIQTSVSTATQVKAAVDASAAAMLLVGCAVTGTGGTAQTAPVSATALSAGTDTKVDLTTNYVTIATHGFTNGSKIRLTTTSALPTGLSTGTDYWIIKIDANTIAFASSYALFAAGTPVDITGYGVGTQTATPKTLSYLIKAQYSNDGTNYFDAVSALNSTLTSGAQTAAVSIYFADSLTAVKYMRIAFVVTDGLISGYYAITSENNSRRE